MSGERSAIEKSMEEILIDLMIEKVIFARVQASLTGGLQASPSTRRRSGLSRTATEKIRKHRDDLANAKEISLLLPDYIPPLASVVSHDSFPWDFKYTLIAAYLPKWIRTVKP
jgi:hypothetical protein